MSNELQRPATPIVVREWLSRQPSWLVVRTLRREPDSRLEYLDSGEREALALAEELQADQVLLDERAAWREAQRRKLPVIGTLGVLQRASELGLIDLRFTLERLQQTTFYVRPELIESLLAEDAERKKRN